MEFTAEEKRDAGFHAPLGPGFERPDTNRIVRNGWVQLVTPSAPYLNEVSFSAIDESDVDRAIDDVIATYAAIDKDVKWYVGPRTRPTTMGDHLARRGFRSSVLRVMGAETSMRVPYPDDVVVERIEEDGLDRFVKTGVVGWAMSDDQIALERASCVEAFRASPRIAHVFLATIAGEPVGTAALLLRDGYAYMVGTQVLEHARGRGAYKALVEARLAFLRERGISYAITHAFEATSAPILEHLGFEALFQTQRWLLARPHGARP